MKAFELCECKLLVDRCRVAGRPYYDFLFGVLYATCDSAKVETTSPVFSVSCLCRSSFMFRCVRRTSGARPRTKTAPCHRARQFRARRFHCARRLSTLRLCVPGRLEDVRRHQVEGGSWLQSPPASARSCKNEDSCRSFRTWSSSP